MLNTVDNLPCADFQNIDTSSTSAKDEFLIFTDLKKTDWLKMLVDCFPVKVK